MAKNTSVNVPAWMTTFADLMALMMTFFVLLYSFSSIDETKYRMIVNSMAEGFGAVLSTPSRPSSVSIGPSSMFPSPMSRAPMQRSPSRPSSVNQAQVQARQVLENVEERLRPEIDEGLITVQKTGNTVIIRFPEEIAFPPGSDDITDEIIPILKRVTEALSGTQGTLMIGGHTDDRPINSAEFSSNWELSADRAVSVIHRLLDIGTIEASRITAVGYADTRPVAPNDSPENRAKNRRVEISIIQEES